MEVPDLFDLVKQVYESRPWDLSTKEQCGLFTEFCASRLYKDDSDFGLLKKRPEQNNYKGHAVDAILHKSTGFAIDLIGQSESDNAYPIFLVKDDYVYTDSFWIRPDEIISDNSDKDNNMNEDEVSYDQLINGPEPYANQIAEALNKHRQGWAPTDLAHFFWQLCIEKRSLENILKEISGA